MNDGTFSFIALVKKRFGKFLNKKQEDIQLKFNKTLNDIFISSDVSKTNNLIKKVDKYLSIGAVLYVPTAKLNIDKNFSASTQQVLGHDLTTNINLYESLINSDYIDEKTKSKLDTVLLLSFLNDLIMLNYIKEYEPTSLYLKKKKLMNENFCAFSELNKIIDRGYIFKTNMARFLGLYITLCHNEIYDNLSSKLKFICYNEYSKLSIVGKRAIAAILVSSKNEEAVFNLINYGLKLNWNICLSGNDNLLAFEMLSLNKWAIAIIESPHFDILETSKKKENILHNLSASVLEDAKFESSLRRKILSLNQKDKQTFLHQLNNNDLTPLMKAVIFQDEKVIEFIESFDIKPWDEAPGATTFKSALGFLNDYLLKYEGVGSFGAIIDAFKSSFWLDLAKRWNSEYYYQMLQNNIAENKSSKKSVMKI